MVVASATGRRVRTSSRCMHIIRTRHHASLRFRCKHSRHIHNARTNQVHRIPTSRRVKRLPRRAKPHPPHAQGPPSKLPADSTQQAAYPWLTVCLIYFTLNCFFGLRFIHTLRRVRVREWETRFFGTACSFELVFSSSPPCCPASRTTGRAWKSRGTGQGGERSPGPAGFGLR